MPSYVRAASQVILSGLAGLVVWEIFARVVAPYWIGGPLDPLPLIQMTFGLTGVPAEAVHILTGLVAYPVGYLFIMTPLAAMVMPRANWLLLGAVYGVGLWVFAMYVIASLVGGMPPFLGFQPIAWASLAGHVGLGLGIAGAAGLTSVIKY